MELSVDLGAGASVHQQVILKTGPRPGHRHRRRDARGLAGHGGRQRLFPTFSGELEAFEAQTGARLRLSGTYTPCPSCDWSGRPRTRRLATRPPLVGGASGVVCRANREGGHAWTRLRAWTTGADSRREAVNAHPDHRIDGPVGDLAVTDLDHNGVDDTTGLTRSNGRLCHSTSSPSTRSVIPEIVSREILAPYTSPQQRPSPLIAVGQPLRFWHDFILSE